MLDHNPQLEAIGAFLTGLRPEEIIKVREDVHGGLVVVDLIGRKHTYDGAAYLEASEQQAAGVKRAKEDHVTLEAKAERAAKANEKATKARAKLRAAARESKA